MLDAKAVNSLERLGWKMFTLNLHVLSTQVQIKRGKLIVSVPYTVEY